jgi:hypothetical protein
MISTGELVKRIVSCALLLGLSLSLPALGQSNAHSDYKHQHKSAEKYQKALRKQHRKQEKAQAARARAFRNQHQP